MIIKLKNLGPLKQAEFELGDMTIICGPNNTGKTYATYALFGFLSFWKEAFSIGVSKHSVQKLMVEGSTELDLNDYIKSAETILKKGCEEYTKQLPRVFASSEKHFMDASFCIDVSKNDIRPKESFELTMGTAKTKLISILKQPPDPKVHISLLVEKDERKVPVSLISKVIGDAIKEILFGHLFPNAFIASAERTGAAIFRKELNFARNRLLEQMGTLETELNMFELLSKVYSDYALPVRANVDFTRQLESAAKKESFISKKNPELLADFSDIIGGEYTVTRSDELFFVPKANKRLKLTMDESSSAVRSLLDVGFYLRHVAQAGDLFVIDEPELNLHPENQRRIARLFARLMNLGIKIFMTTHSDYIIKELNTLIMLKQDKPHLKRIMEHESYEPEELLSSDRVKVYIAEEALILLDGGKKKTRWPTLTPADIDPKLGIEARSFDKTIEAMNRIQEEIVWGGDENA
ncbi:AAA family ATPase [Desulfatirhabdium butyrativorans]|uniref:AAA family ATPase n=1 Tax=Desulfatirhabdium butyrativorans TaxID=340467 RepID=UPI0003F60AC5|nr:AAA family ATPase [Desulfatirhabdium butyrativorans]